MCSKYKRCMNNKFSDQRTVQSINITNPRITQTWKASGLF